MVRVMNQVGPITLLPNLIRKSAFLAFSKFFISFYINKKDRVIK
jgi:hypothetical protein